MPLLVLGALTDVIKVPAVLVMIAIAIAGVAVASAMVTRREHDEPSTMDPLKNAEEEEVGSR